MFASLCYFFAYWLLFSFCLFWDPSGFMWIDASHELKTRGWSQEDELKKLALRWWWFEGRWSREFESGGPWRKPFLLFGLILSFQLSGYCMYHSSPRQGLCSCVAYVVIGEESDTMVSEGHEFPWLVGELLKRWHFGHVRGRKNWCRVVLQEGINL